MAMTRQAIYVSKIFINHIFDKKLDIRCIKEHHNLVIVNTLYPKGNAFLICI